MIEFCSNCGNEHETGNKKPEDGDPLKICPKIKRHPERGDPHPRIMAPIEIQMYYKFGYIDAIHVAPPCEPDCAKCREVCSYSTSIKGLPLICPPVID